MVIRVCAFTKQGRQTTEKLIEKMPSLHLKWREDEPLQEWTGEAFADHQPILSLLEKQPDITCLEIIGTLKLPVSIDTVWRFLQQAGYHRKKKSLHASEQERPRCGAEEKRLERPYIWIQGK